MDMRVKYDPKEFQRLFKGLDTKQARFAASVALNRVGQQAKEEIKGEMKAVFSNPSRFTLNASQLKPSNKNNLTAIVGLKDDADYLEPQVFGGVRKRKRSEVLLNPVLKPKRYYVPVTGQKLSLGELQKILSFFKVRQDTLQNTTAKSQKRKAKPMAYFVTKSKKGNPIALKPMGARRVKLMFTGARQPRYEKRLDISGVVDAVMSVHFLPKFRVAYEEAMQNATKM